MEEEQLKLLKKLTRNIKEKQRTMSEKESLKSLQGAGILDKNGNFIRYINA